MKFRLPDLEIQADNPFANDALNRKPVVDFLSGLIDEFSGPFVLALDSQWGTGKTTLVRMLKAQLERENFQCVYFNAWQADYVSDPLVALVSALDSIDLKDSSASASFKEGFTKIKKITTVVAKRSVVAAVKAATLGGLDLEEAAEGVVADLAGDLAGDAVSLFQKERAALDQLRSELEVAIAQLQAAGKRESLIFFIDELDRCRPTYAIEVLERIKHLFDLSTIVFVLSVDKAQLAASVSAVYGEKTNAQEYLRRFFDLEFGIPSIESKRHTQDLVNRFELDKVFNSRKHHELQYDASNFVDYFSALADVFGLTLRARERCMTMLAVVLHQTAEDQFLYPELVAFFIVLRAVRPELFQALSNGTCSPEAVMTAVGDLPKGREFVADHTGIVLESYLWDFDPDRTRADAYYKKLEDLWNSNQGEPAARTRASELLRIRGAMSSSRFRKPDYRKVAAKIDLAASLQR